MADNKDTKVHFNKTNQIKEFDKYQLPDTTQGIKNIKENKQSTRSAFKGSREEDRQNNEQPRRRNAVIYTPEEAKKIAQQVGAELLRKQASPKERAKEDREAARDIAKKARGNKRSQGR